MSTAREKLKAAVLHNSNPSTLAYSNFCKTNKMRYFWGLISLSTTYFLGEKGRLLARFRENVNPTNGRSLPVNPFPSYAALYFSKWLTRSGLSGSNSSKWDVSAAPSKLGTYGGTAETEVQKTCLTFENVCANKPQNSAFLWSGIKEFQLKKIFVNAPPSPHPQLKWEHCFVINHRGRISYLYYM